MSTLTKRVAIVTSMVKIIKISYNTCYLPKDWKLTNVVPIHKKRSKDNIKNYRPISLTCLVMKLFEKNLKEELLLREVLRIDNFSKNESSPKTAIKNKILQI